MSACPECATTVPTGAGLRPSELVECPACRSELEVLSISPVTFALAPEPEEDWGE
ncbi:lysine biosynthesis protein LysW [Micromonospora tulbaghiae]|uniref:Alpha-aminoadipate carrier protein LysW n=1 Tax=Micromonospora tulbaghiae TaxID=479978 RepID=A0AAW4JTJ4_9ACTN|nr:MULTISPECIES: lysine biosynthesis protein LysW [Micromonospora]KAB1904390.1 lysine biosynthesis protein LysW [Micromonospora sp. AMSO1212t]MBO4142156.1 lysine biosynthesis protein LysW [Micromonospora tulbaghiae]MDX5461809.1 lysine biosynthesis protein LysW [Micromonospora tulbaghiae]SCF14716.1 alpha-aminoadipate carrier protein LysW [Micromonospora tulbaghiae]